MAVRRQSLNIGTRKCPYPKRITQFFITSYSFCWNRDKMLEIL